MSKELPFIHFRPQSKQNFGFEIISIDTIRKSKYRYSHNPEKPHQLKFYTLIFFTEGSGRHYIDFNWYSIRKNTLLYLSKEQVHAFDFSTGLNGHCIMFDENYFLDCLSEFSDDFVFRLFTPQLYSPLLNIPEHSKFMVYFNLLNSEFHNHLSFRNSSILKSLFIILVTKAEEIKQKESIHIKESSQTIIVKKFIALIEENFATSRNATFYANKLAITYKHLNSICKEVLGKTAKNVIDEMLILYAKRLLINSELRSNELSYKLGFDDPTNFSKYFKKHTGLTPKLFKNDTLLI